MVSFYHKCFRRCELSESLVCGLNPNSHIHHHNDPFRDPTWFKALSPVTETSDNWMLRFNNLKKLHKLIVRYYEEILGQDIESIPSVNLNAIAKDADTKDLLRLCQLVVALAVQSDNNNMYIEMIQSLTQKSQHALMVSIEEVKSRHSRW